MENELQITHSACHEFHAFHGTVKLIIQFTDVRTYGSYPEPPEHNPHTPHPITIISSSILCSHLRQAHPIRLFL